MASNIAIISSATHFYAQNFQDTGYGVCISLSGPLGSVFINTKDRYFPEGEVLYTRGEKNPWYLGAFSASVSGEENPEVLNRLALEALKYLREEGVELASL